MPSFFARQCSDTSTTRLFADKGWAAAVRGMVGRHDPDHELANRFVDGFIDRLRAALVSSDHALDQQREQLAEAARNTFAAVGAEGDDGVVFTVFVAANDKAHVLNVGPHRAFIAGARSTTVLTPQSLAEEVRRRGSTPLPQHALMPMRNAGETCAAADIDAAEVVLEPDTWLVAQLDDRAPLNDFAVNKRCRRNG